MSRRSFTQFLGALNACASVVGNDGFAGHCDWRLPTAAELNTLIDIDAPGCTDFAACTYPELIPTAFAPSSNPFAGPYYWTSIGNATNAHSRGFNNTSCLCLKSTLNAARAVRDDLPPPAFLP